jgi:hypothetical protein
MAIAVQAIGRTLLPSNAIAPEATAAITTQTMRTSAWSVDESAGVRGQIRTSDSGDADEELNTPSW